MAMEKALISESWLPAKTKIAVAADGRIKGRQIDLEIQQDLLYIR